MLEVRDRTAVGLYASCHEHDGMLQLRRVAGNRVQGDRRPLPIIHCEPVHSDEIIPVVGQIGIVEHIGDRGFGRLFELFDQHKPA